MTRIEHLVFVTTAGGLSHSAPQGHGPAGSGPNSESLGKELAPYGERRYLALGMIGDRLHAAMFTPRAGKVHVISLRKANQREVKAYEQKTQP